MQFTTQSAAQSATQSAANGPRPFYKNPYVIAGLIGIVLITISRPLMQNVPPPPPVFDALEPLVFETPKGALSVPSQGAKTLWVLYTFSPQCGEACDKMNQQISTFAERARRDGLDLRVLAVFPPSERDFLVQAPLFLSSELVTPVYASELPPLFPVLSAAAPLVWFSPFALLIDHQGLTRGLYSCDETGLDELFHRARHLSPR